MSVGVRDQATQRGTLNFEGLSLHLVLIPFLAEPASLKDPSEREADGEDREHAGGGEEDVDDGLDHWSTHAISPLAIAMMSEMSIGASMAVTPSSQAEDAWRSAGRKRGALGPQCKSKTDGP